MTEECDKLLEDIVTLQKQLVAKTAENLQATVEAQKAVCGLKAEVDDRKMKFLNLGVELQTRGMSTLCMVQDGKWYRVEVNGNVPCSPGDEEPTSPILTTNKEETLKSDQKKPEANDVVPTTNKVVLESEKE
ncbi:hypothetical protein SESBI_26275 [Sesbania bispinosa]|nr:hypothetical protein SESBI_26275 [Sesbania bispinosa]